MAATRTTAPEPVLVLLDSHGVYIPQLWCSDITEPDCDALRQDGDLWEVPEGFSFEES